MILARSAGGVSEWGFQLAGPLRRDTYVRNKTFFSIVMVEADDDTDGDRFLELWDHAAAVMQSQPGFIRTEMFRTIRAGSKFMLVNSSEWETEAEWTQAMQVCTMLNQDFARVEASGYHRVRDVPALAGTASVS